MKNRITTLFLLLCLSFTIQASKNQAPFVSISKEQAAKVIAKAKDFVKTTNVFNQSPSSDDNTTKQINIFNPMLIQIWQYKEFNDDLKAINKALAKIKRDMAAKKAINCKVNISKIKNADDAESIIKQMHNTGTRNTTSIPGNDEA